MCARVTAATHLGALLTRSTPRPAPGIAKFQALATDLAAARAAVQTKALKTRLKMQARGEVESLPPNDVQLGVKRARERLRKEGLPEGQP